MIPAPFAYARASTVDETVDLLRRGAGRSRILAGGQSLLQDLKARRTDLDTVVDIGGISGLRFIERRYNTVAIGALTRHADLELSGQLADWLPIMREAALVVADPPVRNQGTFAGSLAYADPSGDWPAVALALDAVVQTSGSNGERSVAVDGMVEVERKTVLATDEIITRVDLPLPPPGAGMTYLKLRHPSSGYALVGVAAVINVDARGVCTHCRLGVTGAGTVAVRIRSVEDALRGEVLSTGRITSAAARVADVLTLRSDPYADPAYRADLARIYAARALRTAWHRAAAA